MTTASADGAVLLSTRGLSKSYGPFKAVDAVDLDVHEHDIHVFIGPNGAGKSTVLNLLGGAEHATPGNNDGYNAYTSMMALVLAMRSANFTGKADTDKLISAFETLTVKQGPDFPDGDLIMNKDDHQGRTTYYLLKINGQKEEVVQTFPADQLPLVGHCKIK